jgi:hypothetical protein
MSNANIHMLADKFGITGDCTGHSLTQELCERSSEGLLIPPPEYYAPNLALRTKIIQEAQTNTEFRAVIKALALEDPHVFFNLFAWTYDPRQDRYPHDFPFLLYPFQSEFVDHVVFDAAAGGFRRVLELHNLPEFLLSFQAVASFIGGDAK